VKVSMLTPFTRCIGHVKVPQAEGGVIAICGLRYRSAHRPASVSTTQPSYFGEIGCLLTGPLRLTRSRRSTATRTAPPLAQPDHVDIRIDRDCFRSLLKPSLPQIRSPKEPLRASCPTGLPSPTSRSPSPPRPRLTCPPPRVHRSGSRQRPATPRPRS
jgi:hypothetical protein